MGAVGSDVLAHDLTGWIDPNGRGGKRRLREIDGGEDASGQ